MYRKPVTSSTIEGIGYDPSTQILEISFKSGRVYQYTDVPQSQYDALMTSSSVGKAFAAEIRGKYAYEEVTGVGDPTLKLS